MMSLVTADMMSQSLVTVDMTVFLLCILPVNFVVTVKSEWLEGHGQNFDSVGLATDSLWLVAGCYHRQSITGLL